MMRLGVGGGRILVGRRWLQREATVTAVESALTV
jgi:hypothetical protein